MRELIPLRVRCALCGADLSDTDRPIDDFPGVKLRMIVQAGQGMAWLSPLYGSYNVESSVRIHEGEIATFSCPTCKMLQPENRSCDKCGAPMIYFSLHEDQGNVQICRRKGCRNHYIEFRDFDKMKAFYDRYPQFFKPER